MTAGPVLITGTRLLGPLDHVGSGSNTDSRPNVGVSALTFRHLQGYLQCDQSQMLVKWPLKMKQAHLRQPHGHGCQNVSMAHTEDNIHRDHHGNHCCNKCFTM